MRLRPQVLDQSRRYRAQRFSRPVGARRRRQQRARIGMMRLCQQPRLSRLPQARAPACSTVMVRHILATTPRSWVMNKTAAPWRCRRRSTKLQHLALHSDVKRGGRLIRYHQARIAGERQSRSARAAASRRRFRGDTARAPAAARGSRPRQAVQPPAPARRVSTGQGGAAAGSRSARRHASPD